MKTEILSGLVRRSVSGLTPYLADKPDNHENALHLCFNENLMGPSPKAVKAIVQAALKVHLYPDPGGWDLREQLSRQHKLPTGAFILGNGADSLISLISMTFLNPGDEVIFCEPTFPIYKSATLISMGIPKGLPLDDAYRFDLEAMAGAITSRTKLVYLCNPNNPTGTLRAPDEIESFLKRIPDGALVIFDEAYVDFMDTEFIPPTTDWIKAGYPLISLRTFSKAYGLAGIRIGYAMAAEEIIAYLFRTREPFAVSSLALAAAGGALADTQHYQGVIETLTREREILQQEFSKRGLPFIPSQANFILVNLQTDAQTICNTLAGRGVLIRCSASWEMPTWARVSIGTPQANKQFLEALDGLLAK
jgi:histidinol-phosphate aminotransferase